MVKTRLDEMKKALRKELKDQLQAILPGQKAAMDKALLKRLLGLQQIQSANHVFCFVSTGDEVDTHGFIDWLTNEDKQVSVPTICHEDMVPSRFSSWSLMQANDFGILEPVDKEVINASIDACIIPGVGYSMNGDRLGRGQGYYDRWLSKHPDILRIAPAYETQIVNDLPVEIHDMGVHIIVTEKRSIRV